MHVKIRHEARGEIFRYLLDGSQRYQFDLVETFASSFLDLVGIFSAYENANNDL